MENIMKAYKMIREAKDKGAEVVVLGEMFACPFNLKMFG
jgi:predicted amidohydrolase